MGDPVAYPGTVFARLAGPIQRLLKSEGWEGPTAAQRAAVPTILEGEHTLLIAPTGMGKTEAAILPLFHQLLTWRERTDANDGEEGFHLIYVTPLRALNRDLLNRLEAWGEALGIRVAVRHGDTTQYERTKQSKDPPDVLITTPETLQLLFTGHRLRSHLPAVKWLVIDEVHELAADERGAQLAVAMERLAEYAGAFQRVGLSATVGDEAAVAAYLGGPGRSVEVVEVPVAKELDVVLESPEPTPEDETAAARLACRPHAAAHLRRIAELVASHEATLVFVNTRETAEVLAARIRMYDEDLPMRVHHGSLSKEVRVEAEEAFRRGDARGLICTSSMELGIDIGHADLVVQVNSPRQVVRLVQRVGRAGHRADVVSNGVVLGQDPDDVGEALVIVERTHAGELEVIPGPEEPLDVLANQLAAMTIERDDPQADWAYDVVRRSHPFRDLDEAVFQEVLEVLADRWVVWQEAGGFGRRRRSFKYFFDNVSMIPDERTFRLENIATGSTVATLDESFVMSFIEPGASFICQGQAWSVAEIDEEVVRVSPLADPLGAVPSWIGEEIPVPHAVAQAVGRLRQRTWDLVEAHGVEEAAERLAAERPVTRDATRRWARYVAEQEGYTLPTHEVLTLEQGEKRAILNACLGHKVNETLGRLIASLLTARLGTSVGLDVDPYRVVLTLPSGVGPQDVLEVLMETPAEGLEELLRIVLQESHDLRHRLVHVAKKFGVLDSDADWRKVNIKRLLDVYRETPIYREAVREVLQDKLDVPRAGEVLSSIQSGDLPVVVQELSPMGLAGVDKNIELVSPARAHRTLLEAMRDRLLDQTIMLLCLHCRDWRARTRVKRARERLRCPRCEAVMIGVTRPWNEVGIRAWRKDPGERSPEERKEVRRLLTSANLVMDHGERALMALAARGVGPDTAGRILMRQREDEEAFLRDILQAEVTYARTRQFWD